MIRNCANCNGEIEPCGHGWRHLINGLHECPFQPEKRVAIPREPEVKVTTR